MFDSCKITVFLFAFIFIQYVYAAPSYSQDATGGIKWLSFEEAALLNKKQPKKFLIDIYTEWCGWCKKMDAATYTNPDIIQYVNKNFYTVKMDAEMDRTIVYKGDSLKLLPGGRKGTHELALRFMQGKASYPTTVFLDEQMQLLTPVPGYMTPQGIEPILKYFGENKYIDTQWEDYMKSFVNTFKE